MGRRTALDGQPLRTKRDFCGNARLQLQGAVERETEEVDKERLDNAEVRVRVEGARGGDDDRAVVRSMVWT